MNSLQAEQRRRLLALARQMKTRLAAFRTPVTGEPVDPSHVAILLRYAQTRPGPEAMEDYLRQLPRSFVGRYTRSAGPQLKETCEAAAHLLREVRRLRPAPGQQHDEDWPIQAYAYSLGWARRLLATQERAREERRR
ncbi:MAG: hypothetical protein FJ125_04480 [Deltaproteobacteria bacterium]|nr:hypothetical protein [Deltaproteobacteria bacterium]